MAEKKSILTEALLDIKNIQSALNANTKEILRSVAREEINSVVKESILEKENDFEEEDLDSTDGGVELGGDADAASADLSTELGGEESTDDELAGLEGSEEVAPEMGSEMGTEMAPELGMDADALGGDEMDMTAASDDDVIAIYKKLSGEDEIEIVGDEIHLTISEPGQYIVKTNDTSAPVGGDLDVDSLEPMGIEGEEGMGDELGGEMGDEEGAEYEIEMGDDEEAGEEDAEGAEHEAGETKPFEAGEESEEDEEEPKEDELDENLAQTRGAEKHAGRYTAASKNPKPLEESIKAKQLVSETAKKYNTLLTEAKKLKTENDEFRGALKEFRTKLVETVVFNSNLTYVTRLFMEHATTKGEKQNIIKRFDEEVSNLKESKKLYKTIANELDTRKPINETLENKFSKGITTSTSKQLNESTAYIDPSVQRIKDLMNIKK